MWYEQWNTLPTALEQSRFITLWMILIPGEKSVLFKWFRSLSHKYHRLRDGLIEYFVVFWWPILLADKIFICFSNANRRPFVDSFRIKFIAQTSTKIRDIYEGLAEGRKSRTRWDLVKNLMVTPFRFFCSAVLQRRQKKKVVEECQQNLIRRNPHGQIKKDYYQRN